MKETIEMPTPVDFLLHTPLYKSFNLIPPGDTAIGNLRYFKDIVDCFCTGCNKEATFKGETPPPSSGAGSGPGGSNGVAFRQRIADASFKPFAFEVPIKCTRCGKYYYFIFFLDAEYINPKEEDACPIKIYNITKIGQFPSYSDINSESILKYRKVLDKGYYSELSKAIGLASHDIGVGSFVYLRRIFESLIEEARREVSKQKRWNEKKFKSSRMDEKIVILKDALPSFLVENRIIYSILSKGIHELSEDDCLAHFEAIKSGIELILDDKIEKAAKAEKEKRAAIAIQHAHQSIKTK